MDAVTTGRGNAGGVGTPGVGIGGMGWEYGVGIEGLGLEGVEGVGIGKHVTKGGGRRGRWCKAEGRDQRKGGER